MAADVCSYFGCYELVPLGDRTCKHHTPYARPDTGEHVDHPPVEGGYRGAAHSLTGCTGGEPNPGAAPADERGLLFPPSRSSVIAEAMLRDAVRTDEPHARTYPTPDTDAERKAIPVWSGCVKYFPAALLEVAKVSKAGNDQHNPGQPLHWAQGKSMNQVDTAMRHLLDADAVEGTAEEIPHLAQAAWRVLARLQLACQRHGAPMAPGARCPEVKP